MEIEPPIGDADRSREAARAVVRRARDRLLRFEEDPDFRFVETSRDDAERYRLGRRTFAGCADEEIEARERALGVRFSLVFRAFLSEMGRSAGSLFRGGSASFDESDAMQQRLREAVDEVGGEVALAHPVVFHEIQCCTFLLVDARGGFEGPVFVWNVGEPASTVPLAPTFGAFLDAEIDRLEWLREGGGHFLRIRGGHSSRIFPALATGVRPVAYPDRYVDDLPVVRLAKVLLGRWRSRRSPTS